MTDQQKVSARSGATPDQKSDAKRQAALQGALSQIERQFGKGTVMRMGDPGARVAVDAIPTGALSLDIALGIGGVPRGRIIEIFGPESSGKTTLVYHILAEAQKLGVRFGSPETTTGGRALKLYSSQRLDIRRIETLKDGTEAVGNRVRVKVVKNKVAAPFKQAEFDIEFGKGISTAGCLIDYGIEHNIIGKSGAFFSYGDERLGQGRNNAKAFLDEHPEIAKEIEAKVYAALGIGRDLVKAIEPREQR